MIVQLRLLIVCSSSEDGGYGNHCLQVGPDSDNGDIAQDGGHQHHGDEGSVRLASNNNNNIYV